MAIIVYALGIFVAYHVVKFIIAGLLNPLSHIPGPFHTRFSSLAHVLARLRGNPSVHTHNLFLRYGPVVRIGPSAVAFAQAPAWEYIHRMGGGFRKTQLQEKVKPADEPILFSMVDAKAHAARRRLFARAMTPEALRQNWEPAVRDKARLCIAKIREEADQRPGRLVDVHFWWRLMTTDVISLMSFGESLEMIETKGEKAKEYVVATERAGAAILLNEFVPWLLPLLARFPRGTWARQVGGARSVMFEQGQVAVKHMRSEGAGGANLFANILAEAEKGDASVHLTDEVVNSEATGFLLAGSETTSTALSYLVWAVLKHPDVQRRLEDEVARLPADFSDRDLVTLPFLNNTIDETLRLHGPASVGIPRLTPAGGFTWDGYHIPEGTIVMGQQYTLVRDETMFPEPERFNPDRFINATESQRRAATAFGIGSRSCIGIPIARMEMRLATAFFFRECRGARLGKAMTDEMMEPVYKFFTTPRGNKLEVTLPSS